MSNTCPLIDIHVLLHATNDMFMYDAYDLDDDIVQFDHDMEQSVK